MKNLRVLIVTNSIVESDPRVLRQIQWLKSFSTISLLEYGKYAEDNVRSNLLEKKGFTLFSKILFFIMSVGNLFGFCLRHDPKFIAAKNAFNSLAEKNFDIVIVNDLANLPAAVMHFTNAKIIFDSHEYYPDQFNTFKFKVIFKPYYKWIARKFISQADMFLTVSEGIADEYFKDCRTRAKVIYNAPEFKKISSSIPVAQDPIKMVHHGAAIRLRKLEIMIEVGRELGEHYSLDLMLTENEPEYYQELKKLCLDLPNVNIVPPVPTKSIVANLAKYDLGIFILPPVTKNYLYTLPNKFFEFMQAGLGIVIGPSPEMQRLGKKIGNTIVAESFQVLTVVNAIKTLNTSNILEMKKASLVAAPEYCAEKEGEKFIRQVQSLFDK
ncbi:glycosyltransferase [Bdellovibrio reynosensis]|uniref:Glycosyltransferase n=1 Tax=Bdellovibrio reynosensis TaxID=2835041 RepID=A0ABY4CFB3_9BACT|nr:glycosyltransferase [Bdellovibrio reynosensis]UOF02233.1 glycosyltransferase [Bdellovibrio reynosensis]